MSSLLHNIPVEKAAIIPPAVVFFTSITGWIDWQKGFYVISFIWVALQIYFRLRKEYGKWKAARANKEAGVLHQSFRDSDRD